MPATVEECILTCAERLLPYDAPICCQRVNADHLLLAGLLDSLPVPTCRGGCISLKFIELLVARSSPTFCRCPSTFSLGGCGWPPRLRQPLHHYNTTSKVQRVNCVIPDILRFFCVRPR